MGRKNDEKRMQSILKCASRIAPPVNYHHGLRIPGHFELPDNILCFFHDFPSQILQHSRYCIVIPFDPMIYVMNGIPHRILPGNAVLQCPYAAHGIKSINGQCRRLQLSFDLHEKPDYFPSDDFVLMNASSWRIVYRLLQAFNQKNTMECSFEIYRLCRNLKEKSQSERKTENLELKAMVEDITEFRRERRENIKSIASQLHISESNLRLRFRKENGLSLGSFLQKQKIEGAQYRLQYTRQTVVEISMVCGYDSVASFSRFFKAQTGLSPLQWRKKYQKIT